MLYAFSHTIFNTMLIKFNDIPDLISLNGITKKYDWSNYCLRSSVGRALGSFIIIQIEKWYKKRKIFWKGMVKSQPGSPETSCSLKFPPGLSPFGTPPELVVRAYTNPIS